MVTRADLPIGLQTAQAVHAAFQFGHDHRLLTSGWLHDSNYLIIVTVPDEFALEVLATTSLQRGLRVSVIREPDLDDQMTALAIEPGEEARRLCSSLPLVGKGFDKVTM